MRYLSAIIKLIISDITTNTARPSPVPMSTLNFVVQKSKGNTKNVVEHPAKPPDKKFIDIVHFQSFVLDFIIVSNNNRLYKSLNAKFNELVGTYLITFVALPLQKLKKPFKKKQRIDETIMRLNKCKIF